MGTTPILNARTWLIKTALAYLGTPYVWGGDDPSGFDCSGFVIECLKSVGLLSENVDLTADSLYRRFGEYIPLDQPITGNLVFYMDQEGRAGHVAICLDEFYQIGAQGGDKTTIHSDKSWGDNAFVKIRPIGRERRRAVFVDPFVLFRTIADKK